MIGRRCASCFSFDEGMPRTHVSFRTRAKKAFFTSLFVGRKDEGERAPCVLSRTRGMRGLFACRVWTRNLGGHSVTRNAQSLEITCRTRVSAACEIENRYDVPVAKSRCPFLESQTVVFLGCFSRASGVTNSTRKCFCAYVFWRGGSPRRASFYPTHAHARRRYVHARERSAYESLLSPTRVRRTSR